MRRSRAGTEPKSRRGCRALVAGALSALLFGAGAAEAQCVLRAQAGPSFQESTFGVAAANDSTPFGSTGTTASYGELSAFSVVGLSATESDGGSTPIPIAHFEDEWMVTVPGQPGLFSGTMTVAFILSGEPTIELSSAGVGAVHNMNTSYQLLVNRNGGSIFSVSGGRLQATGSVPEMSIFGDVPAPGRLLVDFPVVFGIPFSLGVDLLSTTGGNQVIPPGQTGSVRGESTMQFFWDGIVSLDDGSGNDILSEAVLVSCSGTDWLASQAPVPLPIGSIGVVGLFVGAVVVGTRALAKTR